MPESASTSLAVTAMFLTVLTVLRADGLEPVELGGVADLRPAVDDREHLLGRALLRLRLGLRALLALVLRFVHGDHRLGRPPGPDGVPREGAQQRQDHGAASPQMTRS